MTKYMHSIGRTITVGLFFVMGVTQGHEADAYAAMIVATQEGQVITRETAPSHALLQANQDAIKVLREEEAIDQVDAPQEVSEAVRDVTALSVQTEHPTETVVHREEKLQEFKDETTQAAAQVAQEESKEKIEEAPALKIADIDLRKSTYTITSDSFLIVAAHERGLKKNALVHVSAEGALWGIAHEKIQMFGATNQKNPLFDKKINHVGLSSRRNLYVVTDDAPDYVYNYYLFDSASSAMAYMQKVTDFQGNACRIHDLKCGTIGATDYIIVQITSNTVSDTYSAPQIAVLKGYPKIVKEQKKEEKKKADGEEDEEKKKEEEQKKVVYYYVGMDPHTGDEGLARTVLLDSLFEENGKPQAPYSVTGITVLDHLCIEIQEAGSNLYKLYTSKLTAGKAPIEKLLLCATYARNYKPEFKSAACKMVSALFVHDKKKYVLVVGAQDENAASHKQLMALPLKDKKEIASAESEMRQPLHVGGDVELPGPISYITSLRETIYVTVASSDTNQLPGMFYSQAIIDGKGTIVAWTPWQRTGGITEPVLAAKLSGLGFVSVILEDGGKIRVHANKWASAYAGRVALLEEEKMKQDEQKQQELQKKKEELRKKEQKQLTEEEKKKLEEEKKKQIDEEKKKIEDAIKKQEEKKRRESTKSFVLKEKLDELFKKDAKGVLSLCDVPSTKENPESYLIATGLQSVCILKTNPIKDEEAQILKNTPTTELIATCTDGTLHNLAHTTKPLLGAYCSGGALAELGFINIIHMATHGEDTWLCVASNKGVALLRGADGHGLTTQTGFGTLTGDVNHTLGFALFGKYNRVRGISSDDQFLYITTHDRVDRVPLCASSFADGATPEICTLATSLEAGAVCGGYIFNDALVSHGMMLIATSRGLIATAPAIDCRMVTTKDEISWQHIELPSGQASLSQLIPLSSTGDMRDVAAKGHVYVIASSIAEEEASICRLYLDIHNENEPITLVPDNKRRNGGLWFDHQCRIDIFLTDGSRPLIGRSRLENMFPDVVHINAPNYSKEYGNSQYVLDQENTNYVNAIMRSSATGTIFVAADDGIRIYE